ncbi:MAG: hypothetical protein GF411_03805 [Candidatus Lokiarchaeota archaeon]|nr:hypothetical protein [Candidatus Lokiarchaeota archaeon]
MATAFRKDTNGVYHFRHFPSNDNVQAEVELPRSADGLEWCIHEIVWGYTVNPSSEVFVSIQIDGTTVWKVPVVDGGGQRFVFVPEKLRLGDNDVAKHINIILDAESTGKGVLIVSATQESPTG